jgi:cobalamin biosynthesis protein CobD/CbiB
LAGAVKQSRIMSLVEAIANVAIGYGVAVVTQMLVFPVFGLQTTLAQNLKLGLVFTMVSIARSFALRRIFEAIRVASRSADHDAHAEHGQPRP